MESWVSQLRRGLIELGLLAVLRDGEDYGYGIVERLAKVPGLEVTESTVYPLLARLARDGVLAVRAAPSPSGPPRRYYRLTDAGRAQLARMGDYWQTVRQSLDRVLQGGE